MQHLQVLLVQKIIGVLPLELPSRFDWPTIQNTRLGTCSEQNPCQMCTESSRFGPRNQAPALIIHSKPGRPTINSPQKVLKVCNKCMSIIRPRIQHICLKTTLKKNTGNMLAHHQALDTFVGDDIIRRANENNGPESRMLLPCSFGGHQVYSSVISTENDEHLSKYLKMDFSHIAQLKSTGPSMSNKQLKGITQIIRKVGIPCPSMEYYAERHLMCDDVFECVQLKLDYSEEKYSSEFRNAWVVRCL